MSTALLTEPSELTELNSLSRGYLTTQHGAQSSLEREGEYNHLVVTPIRTRDQLIVTVAVSPTPMNRSRGEIRIHLIRHLTGQSIGTKSLSTGIAVFRLSEPQSEGIYEVFFTY